MSAPRHNKFIAEDGEMRAFSPQSVAEVVRGLRLADLPEHEQRAAIKALHTRGDRGDVEVAVLRAAGGLPE